MLESQEKEWIEDEVISRRMPQILAEVRSKFPDEDFSEFEEKAKNNLIPNPFLLEKKNKDSLIVLSGLIHKEYALILLIGIMGVKVTEDGKAVIMEENREIDVTSDVLNIIPQLTSACALSIKNLSVLEDYIEEIGEMLNILALAIYLSVALKSPSVLEKVLLMVAYTISNARNEKVREMIREKTVKELRELGFEDLAETFTKMAK